MGLWQPEDLFRLPILPQNVGHASSLNRQTRATWVWTSKPRVLLVLQNYYHVQNEINTVARRFKRSQCYWKPVNMFHESIDCAISLCFVHPWKSPLCKVRPNLLAIGVCMYVWRISFVVRLQIQHVTWDVQKQKMNVDWHQHSILEYHLSFKLPSSSTLYMSFQLRTCGLFLRKSQYMSKSKIVRVNWCA